MDNQAAPKADNLFGVCHRLGDSFGINPLVFRLGFAGAFVVDFKIAVIAYAAGGVAVAAGALASRPWRHPAKNA